MTDPNTLETLEVDDDIVLRPFTPEDAATLFRLVDSNRTYLREWLPWVDSTRSESDQRGWLERPDRKETDFAIIYKGDLVGVIGLHAPTADNSSSIGYWLDEKMQGLGIMTRSCAVVLDYAFTASGLNRISIRAAVGNHPSRGVPERLGFTLEGVERQGGRLVDGYADMAVYSMLASDWRRESA